MKSRSHSTSRNLSGSGIASAMVETAVDQDQTTEFDSVDVVSETTHGRPPQERYFECLAAQVSTTESTPAKVMNSTPDGYGKGSRSSLGDMTECEEAAIPAQANAAVQSCCCEGTSGKPAGTSAAFAGSKDVAWPSERSEGSIVSTTSNEARAHSQWPSAALADNLDMGGVMQPAHLAEATVPATSQDVGLNSFDMTTFTHVCNCGDDCTCFPCTAHPKNRPTLAYVRYYSGILDFDGQAATSVPYDARQSSHRQWDFSDTLLPLYNDSQWPALTSRQASTAQETAYRHLAPQLQNGPARLATRMHANGDLITGTEHTPSSRKHAEMAYDFEDSESMALDLDSPSNSSQPSNTLDPASFFVHQYTVTPGSATTSACRCRVDYVCPDCLIRSGPNSTLPSEPSPRPTFTGFAEHGAHCACSPPSVSVPTRDTHSPTHFARSQPHVHASIPDRAVSSPTTHASSVHELARPRFGNTTTAIITAKAQIQVHTKLHGQGCNCPTGRQYKEALLQAESDAHRQSPS